jgi:hypothetical protein
LNQTVTIIFQTALAPADTWFMPPQLIEERFMDGMIQNDTDGYTVCVAKVRLDCFILLDLRSQA